MRLGSLYPGLRGVGLKAALAQPAAVRPGLLDDGIKLGFAAGLGPALLGFEIQAPRAPGSRERRALDDPAALTSYRAGLSRPVGRYLVSAFYDRQGALADRYGLGNPYLPRERMEGLGGAVSGPIGSRVGFLLETAALRPLDDDLTRTLYLRGDLNYLLGAGFGLGLGFERARQVGGLGILDTSTFTMGLFRSLGPNLRLDLLYRYYSVGRGLGDFNTGRDPGASSAITQISVRF